MDKNGGAFANIFSDPVEKTRFDTYFLAGPLTGTFVVKFECNPLIYPGLFDLTFKNTPTITVNGN